MKQDDQARTSVQPKESGVPVVQATVDPQRNVDDEGLEDRSVRYAQTSMLSRKNRKRGTLMYMHNVRHHEDEEDKERNKQKKKASASVTAESGKKAKPVAEGTEAMTVIDLCHSAESVEEKAKREDDSQFEEAMDDEFPFPNASGNSTGSEEDHADALGEELDGIPRYAIADIKMGSVLGRGQFGVVYECSINKRPMAFKEMLKIDDDYRRELMNKEIKLIHELDHEHVIRLHGICENPCGLLFDLQVFSFQPFGKEKTVSSLSDLCSYVDKTFSFKGFEVLTLHVSSDVANGLAYLHSKGIAHRDLKPDNVLVSNQHYAALPKDMMKKHWRVKPVVSKITDFGLSRSQLVQTNDLQKNTTVNVCRGTPVFQAPESHIKKSATIPDLQKMDMWSYGMLLHCLVNPDQKFPYYQEICEAKQRGKESGMQLVQNLLLRKIKPRSGRKYNHLKNSNCVWSRICNAKDLCLRFDEEDRISAGHAVNLLHPILKMKHCKLSQESASLSWNDPYTSPPHNTHNACAFLDLIVAGRVESNDFVSLDMLAEVVDEAIATFPEAINRVRNSDILYCIDEAMDLLSKLNCAPVKYNLVNHLPPDHDKELTCVEAKDQFLRAIHCLLGRERSTAVYNCSLYSFLLLHRHGNIFFIDTHPVASKCGGTSQAVVLKVDATSTGYTALADWLFLRVGSESKKYQHEMVILEKETSDQRVDETRGLFQFLQGLGFKERTNTHATSSVEGTALPKQTKECATVVDRGEASHKQSKAQTKAHSATAGREDISPEQTKKHGTSTNEGNLAPSQTNAPATSATEDRLSPTKTKANDTNASKGSAFQRQTKAHSTTAGRENISPEKNKTPGTSTNEGSLAPSQTNSPTTIATEDSLSPRINDTPATYAPKDTSSPSQSKEHAAATPNRNTAFPGQTTAHATITDGQLEKEPEVQVRKFYKGDNSIPIAFRRKERITPREAVEILIQNDTPKCFKVPLQVRENAAFVIDTQSVKRIDDIKNDMNGVYGVNLRCGIWTIDTRSTKDSSIEIIQKRKLEPLEKNQLYLHINCKRNKFGLIRSLFYLTAQDEDKAINSNCILQYNIDDTVCDNSSLQFDVQPHGNRKHGLMPFYRTQKSVIEKMKEELTTQGSSSVFTKIVRESGGPLSVREPGEVPRSKQQVWQIKTQLQRKSQEEDVVGFFRQLEDPPILEHIDFPEDLWILGTPQMLKDISRFCTSSILSHPFSVDPTFNFGAYYVTPFTYRNIFLKRKRSGVAPIFIGPTAIHHSKQASTYQSITNAVTRNVHNRSDVKGFITDGEVALHKALSEGFPNAIGLRCTIHFKTNCKTYLRELGIRKESDQESLLQFVFGEDGLVNADDQKQLLEKIQAFQEAVNRMEQEIRSIAGEDCHFWKYIHTKTELIASTMIKSARKNAGMPCDENGPIRCTTNQSESTNNILTRQKEAYTGNNKKKSQLTKREFIQSVWWSCVERQEYELQMALCGMSDDVELADCTIYLQVDPDTWFNWTPQQREEYTTKFGELKVEEIMAQKHIKISDNSEAETVSETCDFSFDLKTELVKCLKLDPEMADLVYKAAHELLNCKSAIQKKPTLDGQKKTYLVAAKCKKGMYELTINKHHVSCTCYAYKFNNVCKHSLVLADKVSMLRSHLDSIAKSSRLANPGPTAMAPPAPSHCGKKGGRHRFSWRPPRKAEQPKSSEIPDRPYSQIHHNDFPLCISFLSEEPKALCCRQCGVAFPRRKPYIPYDIVLSHKEKWLYPDPHDKSLKIPSNGYTIKFYCIKKTCILNRFPYFSPRYLEISSTSMAKLEAEHFVLLNREVYYVLCN